MPEANLLFHGRWYASKVTNEALRVPKNTAGSSSCLVVCSELVTNFKVHKVVATVNKSKSWTVGFALKKGCSFFFVVFSETVFIFDREGESGLRKRE